MAYPAAEIPTQSTFRIHGFGQGEALRCAITAATSLLRPRRVPVEGPSGRESPTPYFWKATLALISMEGAEEVARIFPDLEDRDPLLIGLADGPIASGLLGNQTPDLWCLNVDSETSLEQTVQETFACEAAAAVAFGPSGAAWRSRNRTFGQSSGLLRHETSGDSETLFGTFAGGLASALLEELLGDNLFNKTSVRIERECLEMRPLRLGRAVESGLAAAATVSECGEKILASRGEFANKTRQILLGWRGPESQPWGVKGR